MSAKPRPFKLKPPVVPETILHEAVARALDLMLLKPAQWTCFPAGSVPLPPQFAAKLSRLGLARGWPDLLIVHGGRTYGLELKGTDGRLSQTRTVWTRRGPRTLIGQADRFPQLEAAGMQLAVCRSVDEVLAQLRAWGLPVRRVSVAA